jgi:maltose O-acetyltransferase
MINNPLLLKVYVKIKVFIYAKFFSTAKISGCGYKIKNPTYFLGMGSIALDNMTIGFFPSPGFLDTPSYLEARFSSSSITINSGTIISNGATIIAEKGDIKIGRNCRIGSNFYTADSDFHSIKKSIRDSGLHESHSVSIGNNVFIGIDVKVMKGVKIGDGSVIGAGSIVTRDVGENEIWGGVPARKIGTSE